MVKTGEHLVDRVATGFCITMMTDANIMGAVQPEISNKWMKSHQR
jgi:hypothetical protein